MKRIKEISMDDYHEWLDKKGLSYSLLRIKQYKEEKTNEIIRKVNDLIDNQKP